MDEKSSAEFMNTGEVARYIRVNEKQIYALIKAKRIPCTRVTGKWLFPRNRIDEWLQVSVTGPALKERAARPGVLLSAGSNDVALEIFFNLLRCRSPSFLMFHANTGSLNGLSALSGGQADVAFCHVLDPETGGYNESFIRQNYRAEGMAAVNLFHRQLGFLLRPSKAKRTSSFEDIARERAKFVNRQAGSGTRVFIDQQLSRCGIKPSRIRGYGSEVNTHLDVALCVLSGRADVGVATLSAARIVGLDFVPLAEERFDAATLKRSFFEQRIAALIAVADSAEFKKAIARLGGYGTRDSGKLMFSTE